MRKVIKKKRVRVALIAGAVLAAGVVIYGPLISQYRDLKERYQRLSKELIQIESEIEELNKEKYLLEHNVQHLEKVMREELGLARPGEEVYRLVKPLRDAVEP